MTTHHIHHIDPVSCSGTHPSPQALNMAQRMICASICAYGINTATDFTPDCLYWDPVDSQGSADIITAYDPTLSLPVDGAFVTITKDKWVVLSLRGTEPPSSIHGIRSFIRFWHDWSQDDKTTLVPFNVYGRTYGQVHKGFYDAFNALQSDVQLALSKVDWASVQGLQVTGHSKGASLTFLFALWARIYLGPNVPIEVNAFAPTPIGDLIFASHFKTARIKATRHIRYRDMVPYILRFNAQDGCHYSVYHYMHFHYWIFGHETEDLIYELGKEVTNETYTTIGNIVYYPNDPPTIPYELGFGALNQGFWELISAIKANEGIEIAGAHSATESYYEALFHPKN